MAHGYDELQRALDVILHEMTDEAFQEYLERHVRGLVESHLDGLGLARFRALLADTGGRASR